MRESKLKPNALTHGNKQTTYTCHAQTYYTQTRDRQRQNTEKQISKGRMSKIEYKHTERSE